MAGLRFRISTLPDALSDEFAGGFRPLSATAEVCAAGPDCQNAQAREQA